LLACFGGAIGIADGAGSRDGLGDLLVCGGLVPALFRGRHFRQEIEFALAVDQDRDEHLAVLCEQDALPHSLGHSPIPSAKPTAQSRATNTAIVIDR